MCVFNLFTNSEMRLPFIHIWFSTYKICSQVLELIKISLCECIKCIHKKPILDKIICLNS